MYRRIIPVVELIRSAGGGWGRRAVLSVDTSRARVARLAVAAGCDIVNDISGGLFDPDMARTGTDLVNDIVPDPDFHQPFIDAVEEGVTLKMSPFVESQIVKRWTLEAVQEVENGADPRTTIVNMAAEIDERIRQNLRRRPALQKKFEEVTGRPYSDDWWRTDVAGR